MLFVHLSWQAPLLAIQFVVPMAWTTALVVVVATFVVDWHFVQVAPVDDFVALHIVYDSSAESGPLLQYRRRGRTVSGFGLAVQLLELR